MQFRLLFFLLCWVVAVAAQAQTGVVQGTVYTGEEGEVAVGATVHIKGTTTGTVADFDGNYKLELPAGQYTLIAKFIGAQSDSVTVEVQADQTIVHNFKLSLPVIIGCPIYIPEWSLSTFTEPTHAPSIRAISVYQTRQYAATYFDPARLATSFPGVVGANDQTNNLVIRGNGPNALQWRLEGVEIVNPNHTANAGTLSDRPASSGGGVNILSAQMLGPTRFLSGAFPAGYGNVTGGIMDMTFRQGEQERGYILQAGLLGIDAAAEGPLRSGSNATYLANYRYSFTGLLANMGVDFGGERIAFQDLAVNLYYPIRDGRIKVFAFGGRSSNLFETARDSTQWSSVKETQDITYTSQMGAIGTSIRKNFGGNLLHLSMAASGVEHQRDAWQLDDAYNPQPSAIDELSQTIYSSHAFWKRRLGMVTAKAGMLASYHRFTYLRAQDAAITTSGRSGYTLMQPFASATLQWERLTLTPAMHFVHNSNAQRWLAEPRASAAYQLNSWQFTAAYGLHSQMQQPAVYISTASPAGMIGPTRAHHAVVGVNKRLGNYMRATVEGYYQHLFEVPVSTDTASTFSILNTFEEVPNHALRNTGTGTNQGVEVSLSRLENRGWYYLLSGTAFSSTYTAANGRSYNTRWNTNYAASATIGRNWRWETDARSRTVGINLRTMYIAGARETPIDFLISQRAGETIYHSNKPYTLRLDDYAKTDLRFMLTTEREKRTVTWSLDIQNALNRPNPSYRYYDPFARKIITQTQLGIIPLLTWRMEF